MIEEHYLVLRKQAEATCTVTPEAMAGSRKVEDLKKQVRERQTAAAQMSRGIHPTPQSEV
jgi:archaellum component FlaC